MRFESLEGIVVGHTAYKPATDRRDGLAASADVTHRSRRGGIMRQDWTRLSTACAWTIALALLTACKRPEVPKGEPGAPASPQMAGPRPSELLGQYKEHSPPPLTGAADVPRFLDWAGASHVD